MGTDGNLRMKVLDELWGHLLRMATLTGLALQTWLSLFLVLAPPFQLLPTPHILHS